MTSSVGKEGEKLAKEGEQLASAERRREARFLYLEKEKQASFGKGSGLLCFWPIEPKGGRAGFCGDARAGCAAMHGRMRAGFCGARVAPCF